MICDICQEFTPGVTIFNAVSGVQSSKWVHACPRCSDSGPCPRSEWWNGVITCSHGRRWRPRASWNYARTEARLSWDPIPAVWWARWFGWLLPCPAESRSVR